LTLKPATASVLPKACSQYDGIRSEKGKRMIGPSICIAGILINVVGAIHCWLVYRDSVRRVRVDPQRVKRFVESAPLHLLEELKAKRPVCQCCGTPLRLQGKQS
jgi:hypothetical protein